MPTATLGIRKRSFHLRAGLLELDGDKPVNDPDKSNQAPFEKGARNSFSTVLTGPQKREGRKIEREVIKSSLVLRKLKENWANSLLTREGKHVGKSVSAISFRRTHRDTSIDHTACLDR